MAVLCGKCGEPLMGSVNRCWKCGHRMVAHAGEAELPPIRRSPIPDVSDKSLEALIVDSPRETPVVTANSPEPRRRGSPFATRTPRSGAPASFVLPTPPAARSYFGRKVAGIVAIVLAIVSFGMAKSFPLGSLIIAITGIVFGIWALYAPKRRAGVVGLILCCIALAIAAVLGALELYESIYGISPFGEDSMLVDPSAGP